MQLAAQHIMHRIHHTPDRIFMIKCSFLELYNEDLRDILSEGCPSVKLRIHPKVRHKRDCFLRGVLSRFCCRQESLLKTLKVIL